jgi:triosephosphate isomerase
MPTNQTREPIVAANWKMNTTPTEGTTLAREILAQHLPSTVQVVLCPPATSLTTVAQVVQGTAISIGAQHVHWETSGAFTGEISVSMLAGIASYVIVGHSERRRLFGETDRDVQLKTRAIHLAGLTPIVAVGESLDERDSGHTHTVIRRQVSSVFQALTPKEAGSSVIAYEPVWAIGTGRNASPDQAQDAIGWIRDTVVITHGSDVADRVRIQYGGSVTSDNCVDLLRRDGIDGALVGGASLDATHFATIVLAAT